MFTLRINVLDTAPLDGITPLPINAKDLVASTGQPQHINQLDIPIGTLFGVYNPGELGLLGLSGSYVMRHCTVFSIGLANGGFTHLNGSAVNLLAPERPGGGVAQRTIIDLAVDGLGSGLIPEGVGVPIPVGHKVAFQTIPDAGAVAAPGPHIVQMTFGRADLPKRIQAGLLNGPPLTNCIPPDIESYTPNPGLGLVATVSGPTVVNITGTNFLSTDIVALRRIGPPDGALLPISGLVITDPTDIDFTIDAPGGGTEGLYELCVTRDDDPNCETCVVYVTVAPPV